MSEYFWPQIGGGEEHAKQCALHFARRGHEVEVLTYRMPGHERDEWLGGVHIRRMGPWIIEGVQPYLKRAVIQGMGILDYLRKCHVDVLHVAQTFPLVPAWFGHDVLRSCGEAVLAAVFHDIYGLAFSVRNRGWRGLLRGPLEQLVLRLSYDLVITVSASTREKLLRAGLPAAKVHVVPNGVDLEAADRVQGERAADCTVCFIGRLVRYKRVSDLIDAAANVRKRWGIGMHLVVIGDGPDRSRLERHCQAAGVSATFTGYISDEAKFQLLKRSWVLVQPSSQEGFGLTLLEAMACAVPVVAADSGGPREVVRPGTGFLYPPGRTDVLAQVLNELVRSTDAVEEMGKAARQRVEHHFGWSRTAEALETLYLAALDERHRSLRLLATKR